VRSLNSHTSVSRLDACQSPAQQRASAPQASVTFEHALSIATARPASIAPRLHTRLCVSVVRRAPVHFRAVRHCLSCCSSRRHPYWRPYERHGPGPMGGHGTLNGARHCDAPRRRSCGGGAGRLVRAASLLSAGCSRAPPAAPLLHPASGRGTRRVPPSPTTCTASGYSTPAAPRRGPRYSPLERPAPGSPTPAAPGARCGRFGGGSGNPPPTSTGGRRTPTPTPRPAARFRRWPRS